METKLMQLASSVSTNSNSLIFADRWNGVLSSLRAKHGDSAYNAWFKSIRPYADDGSLIILAVPTRFIREWIIGHYLDDIRAIFQASSVAPVSVEIVVRQQEVTQESVQTQESESVVVQIQPSAPIAATVPDNEYSNFDPRFSFDNFVVGPTNELAYAASMSIAESAGIVGGSNPLFLYGGVGLGKTHLMHAIGLHIRKNSPHKKVLYLSAEKFMYQFIRALRDKDIVSFKDYFRSVDILMVDDIQFICGKNSTQEEFFHTFNALIDSKKQLVLSGDRSPSSLDGLEERVRSRLGWGLVIDINTTTYELRLGILQAKVEKMGVEVSGEVLEFLARKITSNIRELEGALNKVIAHSQLMKRDVNIDSCKLILRDLLNSVEKTLTIDDIKARVAEHFNIRVSDMNSDCRERRIARPRQVAMFMVKRLTTHSLPEIGQRFGGKDHTTVIHAVKRVEELRKTDEEFNREIEALHRLMQIG
jgi:chromosomal replication initiator protein